jgi:tetratricopeptide (TPR) repeat protein
MARRKKDPGAGKTRPLPSSSKTDISAGNEPALPLQPATKKSKQIVLGLLIVLLTFAVYWPALHGQYLWDDDVMLTANPLVHQSDGLRKIWFSTEPHDYFPITLTSLWLEWRLYGANRISPFGYHAVNVALHALGAILLWRVLRRLQIPGCFWAALVFAVHPVCVPSVAWIAERKNVLSLVFYALTVLCYLRDGERFQVDQSRFTFHVSRWYWLSLFAFLFALLSKTSVVMLPFVLLLCDWWQRKGDRESKVESRTPNDPDSRPSTFDARLLFRVAPFFLLSLILGLVTVWFQKHRAIGATTTDPLFTRLLGGGFAVWFYFLTALLPAKLTMVYPRWEISKSFLDFTPWLLWLGILLVLWKFRRAWGCAPLFALGYFSLTLVPVLGIFDMSFFTYSRVADHLQYLSLISIVVLVIAGIQKLRPLIGSVGLQTLHIGLVLALSIASWHRAKAFSGPEKLWTDNIQKNPKAWVAHNNLGNAIAHGTNFGAAIEHFENALRLNPKYADAHNNYANALSDLDRLPEAVTHYEEALKFKSGFAFAENNLGYALARLGRHDEAVAHYLNALRIDPNYFFAHHNLALTLARQKKYNEAVEEFRAGLRLHPNDAAAQCNLANTLSDAGRLDEAIVEFQRALQMKPVRVEAYTGLGLAFGMKGNLPEATHYFSEAVSLQPTNVVALSNLGNALARQGKFDEAIEQYEAALRVAPNDPETHGNLGNALMERKRFDEAVRHYEASLRLEPNPQIHVNCGIALASLGKKDEAAAHFREALRLQPNDVEAQKQLRLLAK